MDTLQTEDTQLLLEGAGSKLNLSERAERVAFPIVLW